jgi:hypothetical protein
VDANCIYFNAIQGGRDRWLFKVAVGTGALERILGLIEV